MEATRPALDIFVVCDHCHNTSNPPEVARKGGSAYEARTFGSVSGGAYGGDDGGFSLAGSSTGSARRHAFSSGSRRVLAKSGGTQPSHRRHRRRGHWNTNKCVS